MYQEAKTWSCRPSHLLAIEDVYTAYCVDQAVATFGSSITAELDKIDDKDPKKVERKREARLYQLLDIPVQQRFKSFKQGR
jgi:hypothetical protein